MRLLGSLLMGVVTTIIAAILIAKLQLVTSIKPEKDITATFTSDHAWVYRGGPVLLQWTVSDNAEGVDIEPALGNVEKQGQRTVFVDQTTVWMLSAWRNTLHIQRPLHVDVRDRPTQPAINQPPQNDQPAIMPARPVILPPTTPPFVATPGAPPAAHPFGSYSPHRESAQPASRFGSIVWEGTLHGDQTVIIDGNTANAGSLTRSIWPSGRCNIDIAQVLGSVSVPPIRTPNPGPCGKLAFSISGNGAVKVTFQVTSF